MPALKARSLLPFALVLAMRRAGWGAVVIVCGLVCYFSVRLAIADFFFQENSVNSVTAATILAPDNAEYQMLLAEHREGLGLDAGTHFAKAAALSPYNAIFWIRLGFWAEANGNNQQALRYLMRGADVSRKFNARWALANYYFRRENDPEFWKWSEKALAMSYGDCSPLFDLMWRVSRDPWVVRGHIPDNPRLILNYFRFLLTTRLAGLDGMAQEASRVAGESDLPSMMQYVDEGIAARTTDVLPVWNTLSSRQLIPFAPLVPVRGDIVTDPLFTRVQTVGGFGWRTSAQEGVLIVPADDGNGIQVRLSGSEAEDCILLEQVLPTTPSAEYSLQYKVEPNSGAVSGISWDVTEFTDDNRALETSALDLSANSQKKTFIFRAADAAYVRLRLRYRRPLGQTRAEGSITLRSLESALVR